MKKLCLLLAILSLISCCLFSCSEKKKSNANAIITTEQFAEITTAPPKQITIRDIDQAAIKCVESLIESRLRNPSSFQKNSARAYGEFKTTETSSSGETKSKIYLIVYMDYSAQNGFGGSNREKVDIYLSCDADLLGQPYNYVPFIPSWDFTEILRDKYYDAKEKGEEIN